MVAMNKNVGNILYYIYTVIFKVAQKHNRIFA